MTQRYCRAGRLLAAAAGRAPSPTRPAAANLLRAGVAPETVLVTGDTVVDAVLAVAARKAPWTDPRLSTVEGPLVLVTVHRRESRDARLDGILAGVLLVAGVFLIRVARQRRGR